MDSCALSYNVDADRYMFVPYMSHTDSFIRQYTVMNVKGYASISSPTFSLEDWNYPNSVVLLSVQSTRVVAIAILTTEKGIKC